MYFWGILTEPESMTIKGTNLYKIEHDTKFLSRSVMEVCLLNIYPVHCEIIAWFLYW